MPAYDQLSLRDLAEATQYKSWLLEAAFSISEDSLFPEWPDQMIYPAHGGTSPLANFGRMNIDIGDWRQAFLRVGAPLIFVTTFKLLDMLVEWMLGQNGRASNYRFAQKIASRFRRASTGSRTPVGPSYPISRHALRLEIADCIAEL